MKKLLFIIFTLILFMPFVVKANSLYLECDSDTTSYVDGGQIITCRVSFSSEQNIKNIKASFATSENLEFDMERMINKNWSLVSLDGDSFELKHLGNGSTNESVIELSFIVITAKANASLNIKLHNIILNDSISIAEYTKNYKVNSCSNGLNSLNVDGVSLAPYFDTDEILYTGETASATININAKLQCSQSVIEGIGYKELKYGLNTFEISVVSPRGIQNIYTININRVDTRSGENNLKYLAINGEDIGFKNDVMSYSYVINHDQDSINITFETTDANSTVEIIGNENLKVGSNTIYIKVISESGIDKTYTIYVNKKANENLFLKSLSITKLNIEFAPNKLTYNLKSSKIFKTLDILYETLDANHKVMIIGNESLKIGKNKIVIRVENESGETLDYIINLTQERNYTIFIIMGFIAIVGLIVLYLYNKYRKYDEKMELPKLRKKPMNILEDNL